MDQIYREVELLLSSDQSGHNMQHINRVINLSLKFNQTEKGNPQLIYLIALLHDVDDYKLCNKYDSDNLTNAITIMNKCNIDVETKNHVLKAINEIGYSKRLKGITPTSLEAKIVSDADMCDALGANGILRTYQYGLNKNRPFFDKNNLPNADIDINIYTTKTSTGINHFFEKLLRLKNLMLTEEGKKEALYRHSLMIAFLKHYFEEENAKMWLTLLSTFEKNNF
ncbi:MAG: HD domain-containing protein [Bacilli bacterium]|nr:HD domain-containing protein [Bacilli bacterium]